MEALTPKKRKGQFDFPLFIALILICAFGLVMVFSASYYYAQTKMNDGYYFLKNQGKYMAVGIAAMIAVSCFDYHRYERLRAYAFIGVIGLMAAVLLFGVNRNGATRWLEIGGLSLQPAEFAKFVLVLYMASFMSKHPERMKSFKDGIIPMGMILAVLAALTLLQKNMSMMVIVLITWFVMLFIGGAQLKHLLCIILVSIPILAGFAWMEPYRVDRLKIFLDPWKDAQDTGYQLVQSLYALGSGGLFGKGLNFSRQKLLFLTYGESDFIFSIIGEELGFVGSVALIAAYAFVIYRGIRIAMRCRDRFGSLFAAGITIVLGIQVAVNIGVATSSIPPTGQTLPFISAGGTSLVIFLCAMGILLNISRNVKNE